jgi:flagellar motor switch protein FliN
MADPKSPEPTPTPESAAKPAPASEATAPPVAPAAESAAATPEAPPAEAIASVAESIPEPAPVVAAEASAPTTPAPAAPEVSNQLQESEIDELLKQAGLTAEATSTPAAAAAAGAQVAPDAEPFKLQAFQQVLHEAQMSSIDLLRDVELNVKIELGRNRMLVEDVLKLTEGSVVELDKLAGDPVDVFVNDRLVARGEVLVLNDNFCVRVNEIVAANKDEMT